MAVIDPITNPEADDYVVLAGVVSPGLAIVKGFDRAYDWDIKKGKGALGATVTFTGRAPAEGSITFQLWTESQFTEWATFVALISVDATKKAPTALDIYHPALAEVGVKSVVIKKIGARVHEGKGLYSYTIDMIEYFPPPKKAAVGTPSGSKTSGNKSTGTPGTVPDPIAEAQQKEIRALLAKAGEP